MLAGWYMVTDTLIPPASLLACYWMIGAYFMALKRFSELREIGDPKRAAAYRRSFLHYTERSLLVSVMFYASSAMLFFGAFLIRYRIELVLAFPLVALVMAVYCNIAFEPDSAAQHPEFLYRNKPLMICVISLLARDAGAADLRHSSSEFDIRTDVAGEVISIPLAANGREFRA